MQQRQAAPPTGRTTTQTLRQTRVLYREADQQSHDVPPPANIMFDPRVVRGPTTGRHALMKRTQKLVDPEQQRRATRAAIRKHKQRKTRLIEAGVIRPPLPSVTDIYASIHIVKERQEVPLAEHLVEAVEEKVAVDVKTQTDAWVEEPPEPEYVPRKRGVDRAAQVDHDIIFQFDREVDPLLNVLCQKITEQSLREVRNEENLRCIRQQKKELQAKFEKLASAQEDRLTSEVDRHMNKLRLLKKAEEQVAYEELVRRKLASVVMARDYLRNLRADCNTRLSTDAKYFVDLTEETAEQFLQERVYPKVGARLKELGTGREVVTAMVGDALKTIHHETAVDRERKRLEAEAEAMRAAAEAKVRAEKARRQRVIQLFIHTDIVAEEDNPVGPIALSGESTVADVEERVVRWLSDNLDESAPDRDKLRFLWGGDDLLSKDVQLCDMSVDVLKSIRMELIESAEEDDDFYDDE